MRTGGFRGLVLVALFGLLPLVSCATVARSKADDQLFVDSNPPGASIFVNGVLAGTTPERLRMPSDKAINIVCKLPGHEPSSTTIYREGSPATAFDNPAFAVVDTLTGAAYRLQRHTLFVELTPVAARAP
jgi:hypothetical protein